MGVEVIGFYGDVFVVGDFECFMVGSLDGVSLILFLIL